MAESRRGCTPAQQSMCSSNPLAFTSRLSAGRAAYFPTRALPRTPFLGTKIPFNRVSEPQAEYKTKSVGEYRWTNERCILPWY